MGPRRALIGPLAALALGHAAPAAAWDFKIDVLVGGGTVVDYGAASEVGNAFGATALIGAGDFAGGIGLARVLPDSRTQGQFSVWWLEGRWYALGRAALIQPYACVGFGSATDDDFVPGSLAFEPAQWSTEAGFLAMLGGGVRYGAERGIFLAADVRAWNLGHLGISLNAGVTF
ncbi:MAG: hypothetical protein IT385_29830 [Deltaproteobacteria bacterium]|nr:hypothetical protein [Deltaproteobacteria bacterium]